jgi:hypothetical protein
MAFPTIATSADGVVTTNSTAWTITFPSGLSSGDLILLIAGRDGAGTSTAPTGFTDWVANQGGGAQVLFIAGKVSDGTETGTTTWNFSASEQGVWQALRITDWFNGSTPFASASTTSLDSATTSGSSTTPDPSVLNPVNWDVEDTLWLALACNDGTPTYTAKDANYTYVTNSPATSGGAGGAGLAVSWRQNAVSSEDPGQYTLSATETWVVFTVAIRPAAPAAERVPFYRPHTQLLAH